MKETIKETVYPAYDWSSLCILVVEDNYVSYKLLDIILKKTGAKILHVDDGNKAIEAVKQYPEIDLILMDIQLPVMNGYDATKKIKTIRPDINVIAQTANATDEDRILCMNMGFSNYITKPIDLQKLYQIINDYFFTD